MTVSKNSAGRMEIFYAQSEDSYDDAIKLAVKEAAKSLPGKTLEWFEVVEFRGGIVNGDSAQFQVAIRVGYA